MTNKSLGIVAVFLVIFCLMGGSGCSKGDETIGPNNNDDLSNLKLVVAESIEAMVRERVDNWIEASISAKALNPQVRETLETEILNINPSLVSMSDHEAVVDVTYDVEIHIGAFTIQSTPPGAELQIDPQTLKQHYHVSAEVMKQNGTWLVDNIFDGSPSEKLSTERANVQGAIRAMLERSQVTELDATYYGVDTEMEARSVTVKNGLLSLSFLYQPYKYPYAQAYDITKSGTVTVHQP